MHGGAAERNGHHRWVVLFRLEKAWLHLEANRRAQELRSPYGQLMSSDLLGVSEHALRKGDFFASVKAAQVKSRTR